MAGCRACTDGASCPQHRCRQQVPDDDGRWVQCPRQGAPACPEHTCCAPGCDEPTSNYGREDRCRGHYLGHCLEPGCFAALPTPRRRKPPTGGGDHRFCPEHLPTGPPTLKVPGPVTGTVYAVRAADETGPVKLGLADDLGSRIAGLQTGSPVRLRALASWYCDHGHVEARLHHHFRTKRSHGEWFDLDGDDIAALPALVARFNTERAGALHCGVAACGANAAGKSGRSGTDLCPDHLALLAGYKAGTAVCACGRPAAGITWTGPGYVYCDRGQHACADARP